MLTIEKLKERISELNAQRLHGAIEWEEAKAEINRRFNELGYQEQAKKAKSNDYILISEELEDEDGEFIGDINSIEAFYWKDYVLGERIKKNTKYVLEEESNYGFWRNFGTR